MSYIVFSDDPSVHSAQEAERRGEPYWPLVQMGTFGQTASYREPRVARIDDDVAWSTKMRAHACPSCRAKVLGQAEGCPAGQTMTPAGACVSVEPGTKIRKVGWIVATATAITVIGLFAATLSLGTRGG